MTLLLILEGLSVSGESLPRRLRLPGREQELMAEAFRGAI